MKAEAIVPQDVQQFAREFAALAAKHGLRKASVTVSPGYYADRAWDSDIHIGWEAGRHEADVREIKISTTLLIRAEIPRDEFRALLADAAPGRLALKEKT